MKLYKFLHHEHADLLSEGSFRFGGDTYYRLLDYATGDDNIGDKYEAIGVTEAENLVFDRSIVSESEIEEFERETAKFGCRVDGGGEIIINSGIFINRFPCYILSFSVGELNELTEVFCGDDSFSKYSACISFSDINALANLIWNHGVVQGLGSGGSDVPVREYFDNFHAGQVVYKENQGKYDGGEVFQGNPFIKHPKYFKQNEFRIILIKDNLTHQLDYVDIRCEEAKNISNIIFKDTCKRTPCLDKLSIEEINIEVKKLYFILEKCALFNAIHNLKTSIIGHAQTAPVNLGAHQSTPSRDPFRHDDPVTGKAAEGFFLETQIKPVFIKSYWRLRPSVGRNMKMDRALESFGPSNVHTAMHALQSFYEEYYYLLEQNFPRIFPKLNPGNQ